MTLTEDERKMAVERIKSDRVSNQESDHLVWYGLKLAVKDYRTWVFVSAQSQFHTRLDFPDWTDVGQIGHHALLQLYSL